MSYFEYPPKNSSSGGGGGGGVTTIGPLDGQPSSFDGATIVGTSLYMQTATSLSVGLLTAADWTSFNNKADGPGPAVINGGQNGPVTVGSLDGNGVDFITQSGGATAISLVNTNTGSVIFPNSLSYTRTTDNTTTGTNATLNSSITPYIILTNSSLVSISQIPRFLNGQLLVLTNATGNAITINDESGATANQRVRTGLAGPYTLNNNASVEFIYDGTNSRWRLEGAQSNALLPAVTQMVYVNFLAGNDTTGNGSINNPYKTVAHAMTTITDASTTKPYIVALQAERQLETTDIFMKPYTFICGILQRASYIRITGGALRPDPSHATVNSWVGLGNLYWGGSTAINWDLQALGGANCVFINQNCTITGAFTYKGRNSGGGDYLENYTGIMFGPLAWDSINPQTQSVEIIGTTTLTNTQAISMNVSFDNVVFDGNVAFTDSGNMGLNNCSYGSGVTLTTTGTMTLNSYRGLPNKSVRTLSGGTVVNNIDNATIVSYAPAASGDWSPVPTDVSGALDQLAAAGGGGVTTVGAIDSQTPSSDGAVIIVPDLYMQSASVTNPGLVNIAAQSFAGTKTFPDDIIIGRNVVGGLADLQDIVLSDVIQATGNVTNLTGISMSHNLNPSAAITNYLGINMIPEFQLGSILVNYSGLRVAPHFADDVSGAVIRGIEINMNSDSAPVGDITSLSIDMNSVIATSPHAIITSGGDVEIFSGVYSGNLFTVNNASIVTDVNQGFSSISSSLSLTFAEDTAGVSWTGINNFVTVDNTNTSFGFDNTVWGINNDVIHTGSGNLQTIQSMSSGFDGGSNDGSGAASGSVDQVFCYNSFANIYNGYTVGNISMMSMGGNFHTGSGLNNYFGINQGYNFNGSVSGNIQSYESSHQIFTNIPNNIHGVALFDTIGASGSTPSYNGFLGAQNLNTGAVIGNYQGLAIGLSVQTGATFDDFHGVNINPNFQSGFIGANITGIEINMQTHGTSVTNATGLRIDMSNVTASNDKTALNISGSINSNYNFDAVSSAFFQSGNLITAEVNVTSPTTGTEVILNNFAGLANVQDDYSAGPLGLGIAGIGFVGQISVAAGKTAEKVTMALGGFSVPGGSGTATNVYIYRAFGGFSAGGSLTVTNMFGLYVDPTFSTLATNAWGVRVDDPVCENYFDKSITIGGSGSYSTSNNSIAFEIATPKAIKLPSLTTTQRNALTPLESMFIYNSTNTETEFYDGVSWVGSTPAAPVAPTIQTFTTGTGTYTTPAGVLYLKVTMIGAGGGGGGNSQNASAGADGTDSTFGSSLLTAGFGGGGAAPASATGGTAGTNVINSPAITMIDAPGAVGQGGSFTGTTAQLPGANGASSTLGGGGGGGNNGGAGANGALGAGGGGGGQSAALSVPGSGGGSAGYLQAMITTPSSTYAYAVGAGGAGAPGSGNGGSGLILVEEFYQ